jgi:DNA-binding MarR family transcriptional regulator
MSAAPATTDTQPAASESGPADPLLAVSRSFKAAMAAVRRLRGRETQRAGELSYAQYSLLFALAGCTELSSRELGEAAELSAATVNQMLDGLEAHGLVQRTRSETDRRVVLTRLTDRGEQLVSDRRTRFEARWREAMSSFSEAELRGATAVLDQLAMLFNDLGDDEP